MFAATTLVKKIRPLTLTVPRSSNPHARAVVGSFLQIGARVVVLLLGLALMGYLTRRLGTAEYGRYAVSFVLMGWLSISLTVATGGATVRLVAGSQNGHRYAVTMLQMVGLLATVLGALVAICAQPFADLFRSPAIAPLLRILALDLPLSAVAGIYAGILVAQGRYGLSAAAAVVASAAQLLAALLLLENGFRAAGACAAIVAASAVQVAFGRAASGIAFFSRDRVPLGDLWGHTRLLAGAQLAMRVVQNMDLLAVKFFARSASLAGLYAGGLNISQASFTLFGPSQGVLLQSMSASRRDGKGEEAKRTATLYLRTALTYGALLCSLSVLSHEIAALLLGQEFGESGPVLAVLLWAAAFRVLAVTGRTLIAAVGEGVAIMIPLVALIALGLIAYAVAVPRGGIVAAAAVALGISAATAFTSLRAGMKMMGIGFPWVSLAKIACAAFVTAAFAAALPGSGFWLLCKLSAACLLYLALLFLLHEWRPGKEHFLSLRQAWGPRA